MPNKILQAIYSRRSRREFTDEPVRSEDLQEIIKAGIWAPSGLNNQPWRFVVITDAAIREKLSTTTHYSHIVQGAQALIAVYLDDDAVYDATKDHQAAGACIQNMLLAVEELGLGGVWLGQILQNKHKVNAILDIDNSYDLMAVLAIGYPLHRNQKSQRKPVADFILQEFGGNKE